MRLARLIIRLKEWKLLGGKNQNSSFPLFTAILQVWTCHLWSQELCMGICQASHRWGKTWFGWNRTNQTGSYSPACIQVLHIAWIFLDSLLLASSLYTLTLTLSWRRTRSMKKDQQFSLVSCSPDPFTSFLTPLMTVSSSSSWNRSGISPEASRSLINTRNFSSGTWR